MRGKPEESVLLQRVTSSDPVFRMPPAYAGRDPLSDAEIETLRLWIAQGAEWEKHWSFIPPQKPALPAVERPRWAHNPIDRFVLARLEEQGLEPSPAADRRTLIRRASLDLTGLPPTPEEVQAVCRRPQPQRLRESRGPPAAIAALRRAFGGGLVGRRPLRRYQRLPDRRRTLDVALARLGGGRADRNMPFDRFTVEQLAGDLLPGATRSQIIASGFNRNHRTRPKADRSTRSSASSTLPTARRPRPRCGWGSRSAAPAATTINRSGDAEGVLPTVCVFQ